jgi:hypothetical protein
MAGLEAALEALKLSDSINYAATADEYKCSETTLRRRHQGKQVSRHDAAFEHHSLLSKEQEKVLINYINKLTAYGIPPTIPMVRTWCSKLAKKWPGKNWVYDFRKRHNIMLDSRWLKGMDVERKKADNLQDYEEYFQLVSTLHLSKFLTKL